MGKKIWFAEDLDLVSAFDKAGYDSLIEYSGENRERIISFWIGGDFGNIQKALQFGSYILKFFERWLSHDKRLLTAFRLGALSGTLESFDELMTEKLQNEQAATDVYASLSSIKHLDSIVIALGKKGSLNHSQLCEMLMLKDSNLTEIMKKVVPTSLILSKRAGKYKLYTLSEFGRRYYRQLMEKQTARKDEEEILSGLRDYIEAINKDSTREVFLYKMRNIIKNEENTPHSFNREYSAENNKMSNPREQKTEIISFPGFRNSFIRSNAVVRGGICANYEK